MLFLVACNDVDDWVEHSEKLDLPQVYSVTEMPYSKLKKYCNGDEYLLTEMQVRGGWIFDQSCIQTRYILYSGLRTKVLNVINCIIGLKSILSLTITLIQACWMIF